jgi:hypothetical protein
VAKERSEDMAEGLLVVVFVLVLFVLVLAPSAPSPPPDAADSPSPDDPVPDRLNIFQDLIMIDEVRD